MIVIFYFRFVVDGRPLSYCKSFKNFDRQIPGVGEHMSLATNGRKLQVRDLENDSIFMMEVPSGFFLVFKVVHSLLSNLVFVHCEAD